MILSLKAYDSVKVKPLDKVGILINVSSQILSKLSWGTLFHMGVIYQPYYLDIRYFMPLCYKNEYIWMIYDTASDKMAILE